MTPPIRMVSVPVEPTEAMMDAWHRSAWPQGPKVSPMSQAGLAFKRHYAAILTALASCSGDHAELAKAIERLLPISIHETPDYAEVSFGGCQAQAMTMEPETWLALNQLPALIAENAALRESISRHDRQVSGMLRARLSAEARATEAERKLAEAVGLLLEASSELESEVEARYDGVKDHPAMTPKYERDMDTPQRINAWLSKEAERG